MRKLAPRSSRTRDTQHAVRGFRPTRTAFSLFGLVATVTFFSVPSTVQAGTPCDAIRSECCQCGNCGKPSLKSNPIYRTLDTVAGGLEKAFGLDRCGKCSCDATACDACCDSAIGLAPISTQPKPMQAAPAPQPKHTTRKSAPRLPSVPPLDPQSQEIKPRMTEPRIVNPQAELPLPPPAPKQTTPKMTEPRLVPNDATEVEQPILPMPNDAVPSDKNTAPAPKDDGSIFDALDNLDNLDDPFKEDTSRVKRPYGSIRPTGLRSTSPLPSYRPARHIHGPAPAGQAPKQPVGSGLRPALTVEPLRPVSYEQPVPVAPSNSRRVLPPYRRSR